VCGRFILSTPTDVLAQRFGVAEIRDDLEPSWNVAPTDRVAVVAEHRGRRMLGTMRWGLVPAWATDPSGAARRINARAETVTEKPAYRDAFARHRCLVPADGFYEWRRRADGTKQPCLIRRRDREPMAFAGLWAVWRDRGEPDADPLRTCTIVTTEANRTLSAIHDRMPVALAEADWDMWLDAGTDLVVARAALGPAPDDALEVVEVGTLVNDPRVKGPEVAAPLAR
jgi:putative SOS response-associated peptidase YedK